MNLKGHLDTLLNLICKGFNHYRRKRTDQVSIVLHDPDVPQESQLLEERIGQRKGGRIGPRKGGRIGQTEGEDMLQKILIPAIQVEDKVLQMGEGSTPIWITDEWESWIGYYNMCACI